MDDVRRRLLWHGVFLFLLGLVTGLAETRFANIRMGLAAHLEGVMNGTFLLALGAVWNGVRQTPRQKRLTCAAVLYGTYANWGFTTLAAVLGTGALSPITAAGLEAEAWQELLVQAGFTSVGISMLATMILLLNGLRKGAPQ